MKSNKEQMLQALTENELRIISGGTIEISPLKLVYEVVKGLFKPTVPVFQPQM